MGTLLCALPGVSMDNLMRLVKRPVTSTHPRVTVQEVSEAMMAAGIGAVVVLEEGKLVGIVSERDVMARVVVPRKDPTKTTVSEIMTRDVRTAKASMSAEAAMEIMDSGRFRHLPIVDASGAVLGVLSMRHILRQRVEDLDRTTQSVVDYFAADGPGG